MSTGLVVGRFYPPHRGHSFLIDEATKKVDQVYVLVAASASESIPLHLRARWIADEHPEAIVRWTYDENVINLHDENIWQAHVDIFREAIPEEIDYIFASERYVYELAHRMGAQPVLVDEARDRYPISGTAIRKNPRESWHLLNSGVKAHLTRRVVVLGAESSGTTTLSEHLSDSYHARRVTEYGRTYCVTRDPRVPWTHAEFSYIASAQQSFEDIVARVCGNNGLIICDTNALATVAFEELYMGQYTAPTMWIAEQTVPDLYILTDHVGVPWRGDGTRPTEFKDCRPQFTAKLEELLRRQAASWIKVSGSPSNRRSKAVKAIDQMMAKGYYFPEGP